MNHRLLLTSLTIAASLPLTQAKELDGVYTPAQNECPSPDEAIKKMKVPDGYEVRNFASEPMVINPVAMTWDHRGRLWVVELYEYPRGAKNPNEYSKIATDEKFRPVVKADANSPRDRVIVLEDTDNDGKADKRTVFAEGLNLATGILCGYDGVFVGQAPNLFFFRDTNGDDKADEYKTVLTGFGLEDRHELLNSFTWGPDGWLYMTHGVFTHSKVRRPEQKPEEGFTLNAGVFRVKITAKPSGQSDTSDRSDRAAPHADAYEVFADGTSNPWGVDFDARGNAFVSACVIDHLFHMAPGGIYARQGGAPENPYAYELLPSIVDFKHFRAAYAGIQIYQGGIYPADTHGHLFIGNIHDNAVHEESLTPVGATFKAAPVRDFLRANDGWFRPVSTQTGPDGFLWIMDWCDKYPCYQNAQANPEGVDREHGRIWRVCYTGSEEGKKMAGMSRQNDLKILDATMSERNQALRASNNWVRRHMIQRIIEEQGLKAVGLSGELAEAVRRSPAILEMIATGGDKRSENLHPDPWPVRWQAFQAIAALGGIHNLLLDTAKNDPEPALRAAAASITGNQRATDSANENADSRRLQDFAKDSDPAVRLALAVTLRKLSGRFLTKTDALQGFPVPPSQHEYVPIWKFLISSSKDATDKTLPFLIWQSIEPQVGTYPSTILDLLADLAPKTKPLSQILAYKTARRITDTRSGENMDLLLAFLDKLKDDDVLTAHALDGMLKAQEAGAVKPAKTDPAPFFARWAASKSPDVRNHAGRLATLWGDKAAVTALIKIAEDPNTDATRRTEAIKTLRKINSDEARAALLRILQKAVPQ